MSLLDLQTKVLNAFAKIGTSNGTKAPQSQDPVVSALHELYVSDLLRSAANKRRDVALAIVKESCDSSVIERAVKQSIKGKSKVEVVLIQSEGYNLDLKVNAPSVRFNQAKLVVELRKRGLDEGAVNEIIAACQEENKPAESYTVKG